MVDLKAPRICAPSMSLGLYHFFLNVILGPIQATVPRIKGMRAILSFTFFSHDIELWKGRNPVYMDL